MKNYFPSRFKLYGIPLIPAIFFASALARCEDVSFWGMLLLSYIPCAILYVFGIIEGQINIKRKYKLFFDQIENEKPNDLL